MNRIVILLTVFIFQMHTGTAQTNKVVKDLQKGMSLMVNGKMVEANTVSKNLITSFPKDLAGYYLRAMIYIEKKEMEKALPDLTKIESAYFDTKSLQTKNLETVSIQQLGTLDKYTLVLQALEIKAKYLITIKQYSNASNTFDRVRRLTTSPLADESYYNSVNKEGNLDKALFGYDSLARANYRPSFMMQKAGGVALNQGNKLLAINYYDAVLKADTAEYFVYLYRGYAYLESARAAEAVADLSKFLSIYPNDIQATYYLANAYYGKKNYNESIIYWKRVLKNDPSFSDAWFRLALTYGDNNDYAQAIAAYDKAQELAPKNYFIYTNRAIARKFLHQDKELICNDLREAIKLGSEKAILMVEGELCNE